MLRLMQVPTLAGTPAAASRPFLAVGAALAGAALFAVLRQGAGGASLADLEALAVPLDTALSNGKPTVIEFYASWCVTTWQA